MTAQGNANRVTAILNPESVHREDVDLIKNQYLQFFDEKKGGLEQRKSSYTTLVNHFYDLATSFYEYGWGQSFHFAPRHRSESFETSIARHEMYLSHRLGLEKGKTALDVGCGVGGPARCIARFSEADIVGLNNNAYQLERAKKLTEYSRLENLKWVKADFMNIPFGDNTFDAVYQIEATCHAPDKVPVYKEIFRVLKPGGVFGGYEWLMTEKYDPNNTTHVTIKKGIEVGNGLSNLDVPQTARDALIAAGFEILEFRDLVEVASFGDPETPWYLPLSASIWKNPMGFLHTPWGRYVANRACVVGEFLRIVPKGTTDVSNMLMETSKHLVEGGRLKIFTPMYFVLVRKPANA